MYAVTANREQGEISMVAVDYLNHYIEGWTKGDVQILTGSLADNYYLDDPNSGKITKQAVANGRGNTWQDERPVA